MAFDLATFSTAVANVIKAAAWAIQFTDGADDLEFETDSGTKISFAKAIKDFQDQLPTWIQDDLVTEDGALALSANQGVILKGLVDGLQTALNDINALLASDDVDLDEVQELVNYIKANRDTLNSLDISNVDGLQTALDNLTTALGDKAAKSNVLELDNVVAFTPTADYHPATKKYGDDTYETPAGAQSKANTAESNAISAAGDAVAALVSSRIPSSEKGAANGVAELDASGLVPANQLPGFVDDVLEYADFASLPGTGESGKIYVTLDDNLTYRWSGTVYVALMEGVVLGETSTTAYRGDRGKIAYDHSQLTSGNPHNVTAAEIGQANIAAAYNSEVGIISQALAEAGTDTGNYRWTAERVKQAILALAPSEGGGGVPYTGATGDVDLGVHSLILGANDMSGDEFGTLVITGLTYLDLGGATLGLSSNASIYDSGSALQISHTAGSVSIGGVYGVELASDLNAYGWAITYALSLGFYNGMSIYDAGSNEMVIDAGTIQFSASTGCDFNTAGVIYMPGLPTSDPASSGQLWVDSGTLKVSA